MSIPKLNGIDHCHLYVDNKQAAAEWYKKILGFSVIESLRFWDEGQGPLTIQDASNTIHLALFERDQQPPGTSIAFNASGEDFLRWIQYFTQQKMKLRVSDHQVAWSLYFCDPFDNMHEITTSDYQLVKNGL